LALLVYEGMLLGTKASVDPQMLHDIIQTSSGASWAMQQFPQKIFAGDFAPGTCQRPRRRRSLQSSADARGEPRLAGTCATEVARQPSGVLVLLDFWQDGLGKEANVLHG